MFNAKLLRSILLVALVAPACANTDGDDDPSGLPVGNGSNGGSGGSGGAIENGSSSGSVEMGECSVDADCEAKMGSSLPAGCAVATCDPTSKKCSYQTIDADGDGHGTMYCNVEGVALVRGDDCNDEDLAIHPGAWDGPENAANEKLDSCNQIDNDCDGTPDDDVIDGASCECDPVTDIDVPCNELANGVSIMFPGGAPRGSCAAGRKTCIDGVWSACEGAILPREIDTCDEGNDDNCNGTPNDGCACVAGSTGTCAAVFGAQGVCGTGEVTCNADGTWPSSCPITPVAEVCDNNGLDESCNGAVNEGCTCSGSATKACGACNQGTQTCTNGQWSPVCNNANAGLKTYYRDADGDGYCNKNSTKEACSQPSGYLPSGCSADCRDSNNKATTSCSSNFDAYGDRWTKPWVDAYNCQNHTWTVCGAGFHVSACNAVRDNGNGNTGVQGTSGRDCTLWVCSNWFETATVHPTGTCEAD